MPELRRNVTTDGARDRTRHDATTCKLSLMFAIWRRRKQPPCARSDSHKSLLGTFNFCFNENFNNVNYAAANHSGVWHVNIFVQCTAYVITLSLGYWHGYGPALARCIYRRIRFHMSRRNHQYRAKDGRHA